MKKAYEINSGKSYNIPAHGYLAPRGVVFVHNINFPRGRDGEVEVRGSWRNDPSENDKRDVVKTVRLDPERTIIEVV